MEPDLLNEAEFDQLTKPLRKGASDSLRREALLAAVRAYKDKITKAKSKRVTFLDDDTAAKNLVGLIKREPLEDWAGPVMLISKAANNLGISRSTLHYWREAGDVIALPKGKNRTVFPMAQFVDSQPLKGIKEILDIVDGDGKTAWRWLLTPHADFNQSPPLQALRSGNVEDVLVAARWSLGG